MNSQADDMCRRARERGGVVEFRHGELPAGAPRLDVVALYAAVHDAASGADRVSALSAACCEVQGHSAPPVA